jgi:hypothetical protein
VHFRNFIQLGSEGIGRSSSMQCQCLTIKGCVQVLCQDLDQAYFYWCKLSSFLTSHTTGMLHGLPKMNNSGLSFETYLSPMFQCNVEPSADSVVMLTSSLYFFRCYVQYKCMPT